MAAALGSVMTPWIVPVPWPKAEIADRSNTIKAKQYALEPWIMFDYLIIEARERNENTNSDCGDHTDLLGRERECATGATMAVADSRHVLCVRATAAPGRRSA